MPTYEYRCEKCDENFDVVQSFQDDPLTKCPTCGSPVRKVFGSVGIVFKGSGFYKTDSRSGGSSKSSESTVPAAPSGDSGTGKSGSGDSAAASSTPSGSDSSSSSSAAPSPATPAKAKAKESKGSTSGT